MAYDNEKSVVEVVVYQLQRLGAEAYKPYGIELPEGKLVLSNVHIEALVEFLNRWSLARSKRKNDMATLIDAILCTLYYLLQDDEKFVSEMDVNKILLYSSSFANFSDFSGLVII